MERFVHLRRNSLSQSLTALPAPSEREPLARPEDLHFNREQARPLSQCLSALTALPKGEPLAVHANFISLPRPLPLGEVDANVVSRRRGRGRLRGELAATSGSRLRGFVPPRQKSQTAPGPGQSGWKFILRASCLQGLPRWVHRRLHPAGASCRRGSVPPWAG